MRTRLAVVAGLAAGVLLAPYAGAVPAPQIVDPKGDAIGGGAAYDILSVTFRTTRASKARNAPLKYFVVTIELAGPPDVAPGTGYHVNAFETPCGLLTFLVVWDALEVGPRQDAWFDNCESGWPEDTKRAGLDPKVEIVGNKLSFVVRVGDVPKAARTGTFGDFIVSTGPADPVIGLGVHGDGNAPFDYARSNATYKFGS